MEIRASTPFEETSESPDRLVALWKLYSTDDFEAAWIFFSVETMNLGLGKFIG